MYGSYLLSLLLYVLYMPSLYGLDNATASCSFCQTVSEVQQAENLAHCENILRTCSALQALKDWGWQANLKELVSKLVLSRSIL